MRLDTLIQKLEAKQAAWAANSLAAPAADSIFEYGKAVGVYAGLAMAKALITETLADAERKDFDL